MPRSLKIMLIASAIAAGIGILAFGVSGYFLWYNTLAPLQKENDNLEKTLNEARIKASEIPQLTKKLLQLRAKAEAVKNLIPTKDYKAQEEIIGTVRSLSQQTGLLITDIKEPSQQGGRSDIPSVFDKIAIEFQLRGRYKGLLEFIDLLEHSKRYVRIGEFEISTLGDMNDITLKVNGYVNKTTVNKVEITGQRDRGTTTTVPY